MIVAEPLHAYVRVRLLPEASSIIEVVGGYDSNVRRAIVEAVGPDVLDATVGQTVLCSSKAGVTIGQDELLLPETAIMAVIV